MVHRNHQLSDLVKLDAQGMVRFPNASMRS
jgi:hypothetical protein